MEFKSQKDIFRALINGSTIRHRPTGELFKFNSDGMICLINGDILILNSKHFNIPTTWESYFLVKEEIADDDILY